MGFLDNLQDAVNRTSASAGRGMEKMKLNNRINEIQRQRQNLAAQLGASLYEVTKEDETMRAGRESLYDGIAALDAEREKVLADLAAVEEAAQAAAAATQTIVCNNCGATVSIADTFCCGCGKRVEDIKAELAAQSSHSSFVAEGAPESYEGPVCSNCGSPVGEEDVFCTVCGTKLK